MGQSGGIDRKSTRLNSSHLGISYAVFCLKKKRKRAGPACSAHLFDHLPFTGPHRTTLVRAPTARRWVAGCAEALGPSWRRSVFFNVAAPPDFSLFSHPAPPPT